jgi:hypothetical protein
MILKIPRISGKVNGSSSQLGLASIQVLFIEKDKKGR